MITNFQIKLDRRLRGAVQENDYITEARYFMGSCQIEIKGKNRQLDLSESELVSKVSSAFKAMGLSMSEVEPERTEVSRMIVQSADNKKYVRILKNSFPRGYRIIIS